MIEFQDFYKSIEEESRNHIIIEKYCDLFNNRQFSYLTSLSNGNNNVSIVSENSSLETITKRTSLISDLGIISHRTSDFEKNGHLLHRAYESRQDIDGINDYDHTIEHSNYFDCPDIDYLTNWLTACKPLLLSGQLVYLPRLIKKMKITTHNSSEGPKFEETTPIIDAIVNEKRILDLKTTNPVKKRYIKSIFSLDIPILDNSDLTTFSKVTADEKSEIDNLRLFLRQKFLEISDIEESEAFFTELEKISIDLKKGIKGIASDFKNLRRKRAFQISGSIVASLTATLIVIDSALFESVGQIIGASGGLYLFAEAVRDSKASKAKLKENPYYYFWLLNNEVNKKD